MDLFGYFHTALEMGILGAVVVTARKLARLEFMVELMWEEYHARNTREQEE